MCLGRKESRIESAVPFRDGRGRRSGHLPGRLRAVDRAQGLHPLRHIPRKIFGKLAQTMSPPRFQATHFFEICWVFAPVKGFRSPQEESLFVSSQVSRGLQSQEHASGATGRWAAFLSSACELHEGPLARENRGLPWSFLGASCRRQALQEKAEQNYGLNAAAQLGLPQDAI